jgi:uncharacterized protein YkwD
MARGLAPLSADGALTRGATNYARTLIELGTLSHSANGTTLLQRVRSAGYSGGPPLGEVLWQSTGYLPPERTVSDWLNSPGHRDTILNPAYRFAGVGCYFRQAARLEGRCVMDLAG